MAKSIREQNTVTPSANALADVAAQVASGKGLPPLHLWNPPFCGDLDMRIARDGTWFYQGTPIGRPALVRLFSTILKREGENYYLLPLWKKLESEWMMRHLWQLISAKTGQVGARV